MQSAKIRNGTTFGSQHTVPFETNQDVFLSLKWGPGHAWDCIHLGGSCEDQSILSSQSLMWQTGGQTEKLWRNPVAQSNARYVVK